MLVLVLPRFVLRLMGSAESDHRSRALKVAAGAGHGLLYALLIGLPITGWYVASQMEVQVQFLGLHLPALTAPIEGRPAALAEFHESAGSIILLLAGLHALMALWHQFVLHDGILSRMSLRRLPTPGAKARPRERSGLFVTDGKLTKISAWVQ